MYIWLQPAKKQALAHANACARLLRAIEDCPEATPGLAKLAEAHANKLAKLCASFREESE